jgi:hypothetical protein
MAAPMVIDGAMTGDLFVAYVEQVLVPVLRPGDVVVLDNLVCHKRVGAARAITGAGAEIRFLPPYSPDLNPIELAFNKLKGDAADGREADGGRRVGVPRPVPRRLRPDRVPELLPALWLRRYRPVKTALADSRRPPPPPSELGKEIGLGRRPDASVAASATDRKGHRGKPSGLDSAWGADCWLR